MPIPRLFFAGPELRPQQGLPLPPGNRRGRQANPFGERAGRGGAETNSCRCSTWCWTPTSAGCAARWTWAWRGPTSSPAASPAIRPACNWKFPWAIGRPTPGLQQRRLELRQAAQSIAGGRRQRSRRGGNRGARSAHLLPRNGQPLSRHARQCGRNRIPGPCWRLLPGDDLAAGVVLDELLSRQDRLAAAECDFATSTVSYHMVRST